MQNRHDEIAWRDTASEHAALIQRAMLIKPAPRRTPRRIARRSLIRLLINWLTQARP